MTDEIRDRLAAALATGSEADLAAWASTGQAGVIYLRDELAGRHVTEPRHATHPRDIIDNLGAATAAIAAREPAAFLAAFAGDEWTSNTFVLDGLARIDDAQATARLIEANLYKLVNVIRVEDVTYVPAVTRDLALIKVRAPTDVRPQVLQVCEVFRARVVDVDPEALMIEITGTEDKIQGLVEVLAPFGILEMVRTGRIAMTRGAAAVRVEPRAARNPERGAA